MRKLPILLLLALAILSVLTICLRSYYTTSNPRNAATVGAIPPPRGYERVPVPQGSYGAYLRSLPLQPKGSKLHLYSGQVAKRQILSAAIVEQPLLGKNEQCADVAMRLHDEYLWLQRDYENITHTDVCGNRRTYLGGDSRADFEKYLMGVFEWCNTRSLYEETDSIAFMEVMPGDVLVHLTRPGDRYGHAVVVADVARNRCGDIAILCIEGNTPARQKHVVRNLNPIRNPWHIIRPGTHTIRFIKSRFYPGEMRRIGTSQLSIQHNITL